MDSNNNGDGTAFIINHDFLSGTTLKFFQRSRAGHNATIVVKEVLVNVYSSTESSKGALSVKIETNKLKRKLLLSDGKTPESSLQEALNEMVGSIVIEKSVGGTVATFPLFIYSVLNNDILTVCMYEEARDYCTDLLWAIK